MNGKLYLVATPIGNLEDMTFRAVEVLKTADIIAAEDTRNSIKLLNHFEINTPMTSYHEFNRYDKAEYLIGIMKDGKTVALITDAGTPGISDPGEVLVKRCYEEGIDVSPVPGACAAVNALAASGQITKEFVFVGFLDSKGKERREKLEGMKNESRTLILYEAPHRLKKTLAELHEVLGDRSITLCRELTKKHEEFMKLSLGDAVSYYETNEPRGEYVLVIEGISREELDIEKALEWENIGIEEHISRYIADGLSKKDAVKKVAKDRGVSKQEIYKYSIDM